MQFKNENNYYTTYIAPPKDKIHNTLPIGTYVLNFDQSIGFYLTKTDDFVINGKIYGDSKVKAERILSTYEKREGTTGVLFVGEKGSGKTLTAKLCSILGYGKNIITIIVNSPFAGDSFNEFLNSISQPCILFFDEFEKVYDEDQKNLLTLLAGTMTTKKLFLFTANSKYKINSFMINRPGRIYYYFEYKGLSEEFILEYLNDNLINKENIDDVIHVTRLIEKFNFDMLVALVDEMNRYNETAKQVLQYLNISIEKCTNDYKMTVKKEDKVIDESETRIDFNRSFNIYDNKSKKHIEFEYEDLVSMEGNTLIYKKDKYEVVLVKKETKQFSFNDWV